MAMNYSRRHVFPAHISEDRLFSPMRNVGGCLAEGVSETNGEGFGRIRHVSQEEMEDWYFNCRRDRVYHCPSSESHSKDIVDLLPSDPFGMDIHTTFTAITGWLENLEVDYGGYARGNSGRAIQEDYGLFPGWNLIWNSSKFQPFPGNFLLQENLNNFIRSFPSNPPVYVKPHVDIDSFTRSVQFDAKLDVASNGNQHGEKRDMGGALAPYDLGFQAACYKEGIMGVTDESTSLSSELHFGEKVEVSAASEIMHHDAFANALSYLGVKDLLSVERVCRSLCSVVRGDTLLWKKIHIDQPLNERITNDLLLQLACRAQGNLQCLSLLRCPKVTDDGIRRVLETNPRLTKLFVPGSTRLTIEGIVSNIKNHNANKVVPGIKHLRIGGISGVTREYYEELKLLLGFHGDKLESYRRPHFYHRGNLYLPYDDDRAIDVENCPRCENYRLVYDCPAEDCPIKDDTSQVCRACTLCIPRCAQCGRCINDNEYEETFCLDMLCLDCFKEPLRYTR